MKSIIIYYSYSGNTKKVADILANYLTKTSEVNRLELLGLDESSSFFTQAQRAFFRRRGQIQPANFDLSNYDLICFGTPVWAFAPSPAMNTYLDKCFGLKGKQVILFTTYGSGTGRRRCINYMEKILTKKGAREFKQFSIQQFKVNNQESVLSKIQEILPLSPNG